MITDKALWMAEFLYRKKKATRNQIEKAWLHGICNQQRAENH